MISPELIDNYQTVADRCAFRLTGHPRLSMVEQLAEIERRAQHYPRQDVYGSGELIESFQRDIAGLLGKPAAVFLISGTLAQNLALRIWADRAGSRRVGFHGTSHLELHEHYAYRELYQLDGVILGQADRVVGPDDLQAAGDDLAAVLLELPMREIGGQLPTWDALKAHSDWARQHNIALHMDGARLWQCAPYYQRDLAEISDLFDSVYVSFYKDIGGIAGSVLAGPEDFVAEAKTWIARAGANLYSLFPYVLAARAGMERNLHAIPAAVASAAWLAGIFERLGLQTTPSQPPTNLFHLRLRADPEALVQYATRWSEQHKVFLMPVPKPRENGHCALEFSLGQAVKEQSAEQWEAWLEDFYGNLPLTEQGD